VRPSGIAGLSVFRERHSNIEITAAQKRIATGSFHRTTKKVIDCSLESKTSLPSRACVVATTSINPKFGRILTSLSDPGAAATKLDKAVSKGVLHKNQAANRKSAIAKQAAAL